MRLRTGLNPAEINWIRSLNKNYLNANEAFLPDGQGLLVGQVCRILGQEGSQEVQLQVNFALLALLTFSLLSITTTL